MYPRTIHLLGQAHTATTHDYTWCAFTENARKFADLCTDLGHEVILYAAHENEAKVDELVTIVTPEDWNTWWPNRDWSAHQFDSYGDDDPWWIAFNQRTIAEMSQRYKPGDVIAVTAGSISRPIVDAFPDALAIEYGVGYLSTYAPYKVYPSYAWQAYLAGKSGAQMGVWYDAVIPHWLQPADFLPASSPSRDYLLFMARRNIDKGIHLAGEIANKVGLPLRVAGQGSGLASTSDDPNVIYHGMVTGEERNDLLANAVALLTPTYYPEPFGKVAVEAMMCGTPAISTDWGAFPETVDHRVSGFRCRSFDEFCEAVRQAPDLDPETIRETALSRYSEDAVRPQWARYFDRLSVIQDPAGWYAPHEEFHFGFSC